MADYVRDSGDKELLLDEFGEKLSAFQALRKDDSDAADALLSNLGATSDVDREIVLELSSPKPLAYPDRFPEAHSLAVRSLEVLDRNGPRPVKIKGLGPLAPVAGFLVQQVTQFIVRAHVSNVADRIHHLYMRREANARRDDPARVLLFHARRDMDRIAPGFKRNAFGLPLFVLGGAVFSTLLGLLQRALASAFESVWGKAITTVVLGLLVLGVAWVILRGAATAHRRIQLTLEGPIGALWQTIDRCGKPPKDPAQVFALIAVILALLPWLLIPTGFLVAWLTELL
ncbi:MAG: hypothetical protein OEM94_09455 [Acidimicrobiia bacterium]|nr:hypothetical protein [Acidimicrobiia bacterium]